MIGTIRRTRAILAPAALLSFSLVLAGCGAAAQPTEEEIAASAAEIHERVITMDTHVDISPNNFQAGESNYVTGLENTQVDLPKMESGGLDAVWFSIYQGQRDDFTEEGYAAAHATAMSKIEAIHRLTSELAPDRIGLATTADEVRSIAASGRKVALMGMENGYAIGEDISNVQKFADLGVRYLSLAHNGHSQLSDSNTGERDGWQWNGLSPLGREVVAEANRYGIVLDISHPSKAANLETMRLSRAPVMASHSSVRALADHSRNLDDEELRALRDNGGVVQIVAFNSYLKVVEPDPARTEAINALREEFGITGGGRGAMQALSEEQREEYQRRMEAINEEHPLPPRASVSDLVDHIDYAVAEEERQRLHVAACALLLEIAYADDHFSDAERNHICAIMQRHFGLDEETAEALMELAEAERARAIDLYQFTSLIRDNYDLGQKTLLAEIMWGLIITDGTVQRHEGYVLHKIASLLDLEPGYLATGARSRAPGRGT
jgi:membrane dipeptidase